MVVKSAGAAGELLGEVGLARRYGKVRAFTLSLAEPLSEEDCVVQSMPDASPTKWHLAHTTWFFETFVLGPALPDYRPFDPKYGYLFNSYYDAAGDRHCRAQRGLLSRPGLAEVHGYRDHVDRAMMDLLRRTGGAPADPLAFAITLGLHHEQQHQELLLTDIKHLFGCSPLRPAYRSSPHRGTPSGALAPMHFVEFDEGLFSIGHHGPGFAFDNEAPRHRVFTERFALGSRLVTNGEYRGFIADGGYEKPVLWLSDGWKTMKREGWRAPLYWEAGAHRGHESVHTLDGVRPLDNLEPVCHVSYYEADAYARWAGGRLPTEAEWEIASERAEPHGNFVESGRLHPVRVDAGDASGLRQMLGDVWEWTSSPYAPYPGFLPLTGALGEYNGKFMCNQMVLRGGSCATSESHIRRTYRNFFPPEARWQFSGIRLVRP
jgi:ergothioneine biosynthesis protein EgtB